MSGNMNERIIQMRKQHDLKVVFPILMFVCAFLLSSALFAVLVWPEYSLKDADQGNSGSTALEKNPLISLRYIVTFIVISHLVMYAGFPPLSGVVSRRAAIRRVVLGLFLGAIFWHLTVVLLGAPLLEKLPESFLFSMFLSTLSVVPFAALFGTQFSEWYRLIIQFDPESDVERLYLFAGYFSIFGAWTGALAIPLDWDEPWQVWPVASVYTSTFGYTAGIVVYCIIISLRRWGRLKKTRPKKTE